jgi:hypothetical protein
MADFQFPTGLVHGPSPASADGSWYDSNFVRSVDGRIVPIGGWSRLTDLPGLTSTVRRLLVTRDNADIKRIFMACDAQLLVLDGGSVVDITPTDFVPIEASNDGYGIGDYGDDYYGTPRPEGSSEYVRAQVWSMDTLGQDVFALSPSDGRLLHWDATAPADLAEVVTEAPAGNRAMCVTPERHVLLLGSEGMPRRVWWSGREDFTDWSETNVTGQAGWLDIDCEGVLNALAEVREGTLVFTDSDVWIVQYVQNPLFYGAQRVGSGISLKSPAAIATFNGMCVWMGKGSFFSYEAGSVKALPCPISPKIFSDMHDVLGILRCHASHNGIASEVWFYWPSKASTGECDRYATYNYVSGDWFLGTLDRTAMLPAGVHNFPLATGSFVTAEGEVQHHLYQHEDGLLDAGRPRVGRVWLESNAIAPGGQNVVLRAQMDSGVNVSATKLTIMCRQTRDGADTLFGPYVPNPDGWTPTRAGGQEIRVRIEATRDEDWSVGKFMLDLKQVGNR